MLPFATMEEKKLFTAQYAIIAKKTEEELAMWWCSRVDGVNIFYKAARPLSHASEEMAER